MDINEIKKPLSILVKNKVIFENFSYITIIQVFSMIFPLITYPYLTRVLGLDVYGLVLTAQVLSSYCSIIVDFGFRAVSARYVSMYRDNKEKLSEVFSSIFTIQFFLWLLSFIVYIIVVMLVPAYSDHFKLFFFSFFLTFFNILFPQYFFQGIEKMKYITLIQLFFQILAVSLIFVVVHRPSDYVYVPLLYSTGYLIGGIMALYIIVNKEGVKYHFPSRKAVIFYLKDAFPIFSTDVICTIKDKLNYLLLGSMVGMGQVVVYDVGSKLTNVVLKPSNIINTVIYPRMAKDHNNKKFHRVGWLMYLISIALITIINLFLKPIVFFLVGNEVDLLPIRFFLISPLLLTISGHYIQNLFLARGYNKYVLYSILVTTAVYILSFIVLFLTGHLNSVTSFIGLTVISYFTEMIYRLIVGEKTIIPQAADQNND